MTGIILNDMNNGYPPLRPQGLLTKYAGYKVSETEKHPASNPRS
ncbi:hypothetical protein [Kaistella soli]|nr:hypothetical protein [Kaistella soli]